jgi:parallel beta-helix repeat protein
VAADFDRDGSVDLASVASRSAIFLLASRPDRSGFDPRSIAISGARAIGVVNLDADGLPDLVVATSTRSLAVYRNEGRTFARVSDTLLDFEPATIATGALDGDGWDDVVVASHDGSFAAMRWVDGRFSPPVYSHHAVAIDRIEIASLDGEPAGEVVALSNRSVIAFSGDESLALGSPVPFAGDATGFSIVRNSGRHDETCISRPTGVTVESRDDVAKGSPFSVTRTDDDAGSPQPGMLRYAVQQADAAGGAQTVTFDLVQGAPNVEYDAGSSVYIIRLVASITLSGDGTHIAGETQVDTNPDGPEILVTSGGSIDGFVIQAGADLNQISGLIISGFQSAIRIDGQQNVVSGNYIGTDANGAGAGTGGGAGSVAISCGDSIGGALTPEDPPSTVSDTRVADFYTFQGVVGEMVTITLSSMAFNPLLKLTGPDGGLVQQVDGGGTPNATITTVLGDAGIFRIEATTTTPDTYGGYTISLACSGPQPTSVRNLTGVFITGAANRVGGDSGLDVNVISGNDDGIRIEAGGNGTLVVNNIVGTDGTLGGQAGTGLNKRGISVTSATNTQITSNVISGNGGGGASGGVVLNNATATTITQNAIGTNRGGTADLGNVDGGIVVNSSSATSVATNIISNNGTGFSYGGVALRGAGAGSTSSVVSDNQIVGNDARGVYIESGSSNTIGPNNFITLSTSDGVAVLSGVGNVITRNSITANGGIGINLVGANDVAGGVTPNDPDDADSGPNNLINYPVILTASFGADSTIAVTGTAPAGSTVEVFRSDGTDENGEGVQFLSSVLAGDDGTFAASLPFTSPLPENFGLTATATRTGNPNDGTSEFGPNFNLNARVEVRPSSIDFGSIALGSSISRDVEICNRGANDLSIESITVDGSGAYTVGPVPPEGQVLSTDECVTVTITFTPTEAGPHPATLVIATDDPNRPQVLVPLTGNSVRADIELNVGTLTFPFTPVGGSTTSVVLVTNPSSVPVGVADVQFFRSESKKVAFTDRTDPAFTATPSSFIVPPNGAVAVSVEFRPLMAERTTDLSKPFLLPNPFYQTPRTVRSEIRVVVNESLGLVASAPIKAKVVPDPALDLRGGGIDLSDDTLEIKINAFDPDTNIRYAEVKLFNEAGSVVAQSDNTPGLEKRLRKFAKGMTVPVTLTYTGLRDFAPSIASIDITLVDVDGNRSKTEHREVVYTKRSRGQAASDNEAALPSIPLARRNR